MKYSSATIWIQFLDDKFDKYQDSNWRNPHFLPPDIWGFCSNTKIYRPCFIKYVHYTKKYRFLKVNLTSKSYILCIYWTTLDWHMRFKLRKWKGEINKQIEHICTTHRLRVKNIKKANLPLSFESEKQKKQIFWVRNRKSKSTPIFWEWETEKANLLRVRNRK